MADVRLTATNPEDSSVVPVACNAKGELKLEEPIDNSFDGNLDGDLIVSGVVGIGTTDPESQLHVRGSSPRLILQPTADSQNCRLSFQITDGTIQSSIQAGGSLGSELKFMQGSRERVRIDSKGNVGIGTESPESKIHIVSGERSGLTLARSDDDNPAYFEQRISLGTDRNGNAITSSYPDTNTKPLVFYSVNSTTGDEITTAIIKHDGDVGIGTSYPQAKLDVNGEAIFVGDVVVGSRNKKWMLVEQGGLCHMVEQTELRTADLDDPDSSVDSDSVDSDSVDSTASEYPYLRDVFGELDVIEKALEEVMEKLRMTVPNGWPVWDGSDNEQERNTR